MATWNEKKISQKKKEKLKTRFKKKCQTKALDMTRNLLLMAKGLKTYCQTVSQPKYGRNEVERVACHLFRWCYGFLNCPVHRISEYEANLPKKCESHELSSSPYVGCVVICVLADGCCCCWGGVCWVGGCDVCWVDGWPWIWLLPPPVLLFESVWQSDGVPRLIVLPAEDRTQRFCFLFFVFRFVFFCVFCKFYYLHFQFEQFSQFKPEKKQKTKTKAKITTCFREGDSAKNHVDFLFDGNEQCIYDIFF